VTVLAERTVELERSIWRPVSWIELVSSSAAAATVWTLPAVCSEAYAADAAWCVASPAIRVRAEAVCFMIAALSPTNASNSVDLPLHEPNGMQCMVRIALTV
jgi:hypothetical protein